MHHPPCHVLTYGQTCRVPAVASGFAAWADVTHELERGFWPSYNIPYFKVRACDARAW